MVESHMVRWLTFVSLSLVACREAPAAASFLSCARGVPRGNIALTEEQHGCFSPSYHRALRLEWTPSSASLSIEVTLGSLSRPFSRVLHRGEPSRGELNGWIEELDAADGAPSTASPVRSTNSLKVTARVSCSAGAEALEGLPSRDPPDWLLEAWKATPTSLGLLEEWVSWRLDPPPTERALALSEVADRLEARAIVRGP